jgi:hypothetical protein
MDLDGVQERVVLKRVKQGVEVRRGSLPEILTADSRQPALFVPKLNGATETGKACLDEAVADAPTIFDTLAGSPPLISSLAWLSTCLAASLPACLPAFF